MDFIKQKEGREQAEILLFTLSTCGWCYKTKTLLNELGVKYAYIDMDLLNKEDAVIAEKEMKKYTPRTAFPTVIINQNECIVGYDPDRLKELFEEKSPESEKIWSAE